MAVKDRILDKSVRNEVTRFKMSVVMHAERNTQNVDGSTHSPDIVVQTKLQILVFEYRSSNLVSFEETQLTKRFLTLNCFAVSRKKTC